MLARVKQDIGTFERIGQRLCPGEVIHIDKLADHTQTDKLDVDDFFVIFNGDDDRNGTIIHRMSLEYIEESES